MEKGDAKISQKRKGDAKNFASGKVSERIFASGKGSAKIFASGKGDAKFLLNLAQLPSNGHNFFVSASNCTPVEVFDS